MNTEVIIVAMVLGIGVGLSGCNSSETGQSGVEGKEILAEESARTMGAPDPAAVYCGRLGYKYVVVPDEEGNEYGFCVFPDGSSCDEWDFYRGKCGQEWSYCRLNGYQLKNLKEYQGYIRGAVCVEEATGKEIGTVYDLVMKEFLNEP